MSHRLPLLSWCCAVVALAGCARSAPLATVSDLDLPRYAGTWYELARFDHRFERGLSHVTATYALREDGRITVLNQGRRSDGRTSSATGVAWRPDAAVPGVLTVRFFWPFAGGYHVLALDGEYRWAVVGHPSRDYLWFLARTPQVPEADWTAMTASASAAGFDLSRLLRVPQD